MMKMRSPLLVVLVLGLGRLSPAAAAEAQRPAYLDTTLSFEDRAADLVQRMTLDEKVSQMMDQAPAVPRLGVPAYNWWNECLHGVARAGKATVFPQAIGLAATWDDDLLHRVATVISDEARAKHHDALRHGVTARYFGLTMWSPNINIFRDPRWGRGQETYGEDPYLTGRMGMAFVRGLQGDDPKYLKLVSTPKHYAVHSGPEAVRHGFNAEVEPRDLRETYLAAFRATVVEGGAVSVMGAYNRMNGEPCCASPTLLQQILRDEWGFKGYVVSDCGAITDIWRGHRSRPTPEAAAAWAVQTGCDLECGSDYESLIKAVHEGLIQEPAIDVAVGRLFLARFKLGMFDPPQDVPYAQIPLDVVDRAENRALARKAAEESVVLLKNEGNLLPLRRNVERVAVIGPNADSYWVLLGNYNGTPSKAVTILDGIRATLPNAQVSYAQGTDIVGSNVVAIPSSALHPPSGRPGETGLSAEYFDNVRLEGEPKLRRVDSKVDFIWGRTGEAAPGIPVQDFSARWTGTLTPPKSGRMQLGTISDDGVRLWIDGKLIIDNWGQHYTHTDLVTLDLVADREYRVKMDFWQGQRGATARLVWVEPGINDRRLTAAVALARDSDVTVMVLGLSAGLEGEQMDVDAPGFKGGDRTSLDLPEAQERLLEAVQATGKPVVLVLMSGSALSVSWAAAHVPAILQAWYPGEEAGTAVADVLFGETNPAGRLPVTFYRSVDQLPPFEDYSMANRTYRYFTGEPLFPFGYGLSYTHFEYSDLTLTCEGGDRNKHCAGERARGHLKGQPAVAGLAKPATFASGEAVQVAVTVRNAGAREGDEVVQLYLRDIAASVPVPVRSLAGFRRIHLAPGQSQVVTFSVAPEQMTVVRDDGTRVEEPGTFRVEVGGKQAGFSGLADAATTQVVSTQFQIAP